MAGRAQGIRTMLQTVLDPEPALLAIAYVVLLIVGVIGALWWSSRPD